MTRNLKTLLTALLLALLAPLTALAQPQTLTVYDGDLYQAVAPANIYFFSDYTKTQFVIPADDLGAMAGGTISSMKFYTTEEGIPYTTGCPVDVYLKEVGYTTFDQNDPQFEPKVTATVVYHGVLEIVETGNGGELTITFSQPFPYTGGNLLVGMENTAKDAGDEETDIAFYGKMVMNSCVIGISETSLDDVSVSSDSPLPVIPKTTFFYTRSACDLPETLTAEGITAHEATLAWTGGSGTYNLEIKAEGGDWTRVLTETNTTSYTWENLSPGSYCQARVQSVCDNGVSGWKSLSFSAPYAEPHIIVYDGDEFEVEVPAYIHQFRLYTKSQFVVPADNLGAMAGGTISSMKFYTLPLNVPYTTVCPVNVYLKEVGYTTFDQNAPQFEPQAGATVVYQGTLEIKETTRGGELTISFSTPYSYTGGNLLVSIENTEKGSEEKEIHFYGTSVPCASVYTSVGDQSYFIYSVHTHYFVPKTTFFYTPVGCGTPETLTAGNITAHEATLAWTGGSGTYNLEIKAEGGDWTPVLTETDATTHTLENLVQDTEYQARVQSVCDDTVSLWKNVSFSTVVVCPKPADLTVTCTEGNGTEATLSWSENGGSTWQLCLNGDEDNLIVPDSNPYTLTGLIPNTAYTAKVRAYCDDTYQSHWSNTVAFTPAKDFLTVYDGNNNTAFVPANIFSFHNNTRSQFVIPAADLSKMAEGTISSMKFYTTAENIPYTTDCPVDVYVKEVDYTTFDQNDPQFEPQAGATVVYQGILKIVETGNGGELTITFSQPYPYTGGNLLVSIENTEKGGSMHIRFLGTSIGAMGTAIADWSQYDLESGATIPQISEFIPKTTFTYKSAICHAPTDLAVTLTEGDGTVATLNWTDNIVTTEWQICLNDDEDNLIVANSNPFTLTGLIPDSTYTAKVRAHCDDTGLSDWSNTVAFTPINDKSLSVFGGYTASSYVPAFIHRFNYPTRSQFVIPDSTLSEMAGGAISSMTFYTRDGSYTTSSADVYLTEVDYTTFDGNNPQFEPKGSATIVYQGKLEIVQTGGYYDELTITFSTPYPYTGGNLLVGIENTNWQSDESKLIFFYGTIVQGASVAGYASSNPSNIMPTLHNFIPWTTFVYTPASCFTPTDLAVTLTEGNGTVATLNWTNNVATNEWQICLNDDEDNLIVANSNPFTLTGLIPDSTYTAKVRTLYYGTGISDWSNTVTFTPTNDKSLTVFESDDTEINMTVPAYIYKFNCPTRSQFVIPDSTLSEMAGGAISSMKFYTVTNINIPYTIGCPVDVYVKEVDYTTFDENNPQFEPKATATVVYQGILEIVRFDTMSELTITFSQPFLYTGGNLLVGIENTSWQFDDIRFVAFCGKEVMGASIANYHFYYPSEIRPTQRNFIPMTTFVYTPASCLPPQNITVGNLTHQTADISWEGTLSNYAVRHREASGSWSAPTAVADTNMYRLTGLKANTDYEVQVGSECYNWSEAVAFSTMAEGKYFIDEGDWCEAGSWVPNSLPTLADDVTLNANVTVASGCVAEANSIDLNGNTLTIEDGGQLHHNNDGVHATVEKNITAYTTNSSDGWHFIAHPMSAAVEVSTATDLATGDYDLYAFDQSQEKEWRNFKQAGNNLTELAPGTGYLYAHNVGGTFKMTGTLRPSTEPVEVPLAYSNANPSTATRGWNLVGNPFAVEAYADKSYYTMNTYGTAIEPNAATTTTPIPAGTGVMVKADGEGESVTFSKTAPQSATNNGVMQIAVSQAVEPVETPTRDGNGPEGGVSARSTTAAIDKAIVSFNKTDLLPKFDFNEANAKLYIPQQGQDYAIAYIGAAGEVPVHFKAAKNGEYTLSFHLDDVELDYLHLIDNLTGAEVDLLATSTSSVATYTFTAKTTDYTSRFRLVFSTNPNCGDAIGYNAPFAYIDASGNIVITAEAGTASLQLIDVMGRVVHCGDPRHCVSTARIPAGVYVLRLIGGEKVLTQKIVIH